jgi:UPF0755 protein
MAIRTVRVLGRAVAAVALLAILATIFLWSVQRHVMQASGPHDTDSFLVIEPGDGHATIRWEMKRAGLITHLYYYDMARLFVGDSYVPKAGEYLIPARASLGEILAIMDEGRSYQRRLTIIEGTRVEDAVGLLMALPMLKGEITSQPEEGYVLPETYFFTHGAQRQALLDRMLEKREMELLEAWINRQPDLPLTSPRDALILASIVELETGKSEERREVAGVFINRLKRGMRLQSDPTVLYGLNVDPDKVISKADLKRRTDWNTYVIKGLPKTAICNPSREAIQAVLQPAKTKNLYFVSDGEGGLLFAKTLDAHNKNVRLFRKRQAEAAQ